MNVYIAKAVYGCYNDSIEYILGIWVNEEVAKKERLDYIDRLEKEKAFIQREIKHLKESYENGDIPSDTYYQELCDLEWRESNLIEFRHVDIKEYPLNTLLIKGVK